MTGHSVCQIIVRSLMSSRFGKSDTCLPQCILIYAQRALDVGGAGLRSADVQNDLGHAVMTHLRLD